MTAPKQRYRKVSVSIWGDERFRCFTDDAKFVWFFLLTHPMMTGLGAMRATVPGLAAEMGWPEERFCAAFKQAESQGMVEVDSKAALLVLPRFIEHNRPEAPNVIRGWASARDVLPACSLLRSHLDRVRVVVDAMNEGFREAFREVFPEAFPEGSGHPSLIQEQEQEQEKEDPSTPAPADAGRPPAQDMDPLKPYPTLAAFHGELREHIKAAHPKVKLPTVGSAKDRRDREALAKLVRIDEYSETEIAECLQWVFASDHKDALFWRGNMRAIAPMRAIKDGASKFTKAHEAWKAATNSHPKGEPERDSRLEAIYK